MQKTLKQSSQVSRNINSKFAPRGRFAPKEEVGPHWFHRLVYQTIFESGKCWVTREQRGYFCRIAPILFRYFYSVRIKGPSLSTIEPSTSRKYSRSPAFKWYFCLSSCGNVICPRDVIFDSPTRTASALDTCSVAIIVPHTDFPEDIRFDWRVW